MQHNSAEIGLMELFVIFFMTGLM